MAVKVHPLFGPLFAATLLVAGCGDSLGHPSANDASTAPDAAVDQPDAHAEVDAGAVHSDVKAGEFGIQLVAPNAATSTAGFTSLLGKVYDGPMAEAIVWTAKTSEGGCQLLTPKVPFCEAGCGQGVCVDENTCRDNPTAKNVGTVTVKGLRDTSGNMLDVTVQPVAASYVTPGGLKLDYPAFDEGDEVEVVASGDQVAAFSLTGHGIAPLVLVNAEAYALETGKPFALAWTPKGEKGVSRIQVKLDISHHGGTKGKIDCDVEDTGSLSISAALVDKLLALGVAGFPTVVVTRSAVSSVGTTVGRVDLNIYSYVERSIQVPGVVSCSTRAECPNTQTCRTDLTCG